MPPRDLDRAHDADLQRLIDQTFDNVFREYEDLVRTLELASGAKDRYSRAVRQELAHASDYWSDQADRFEKELQQGPLDPNRLDRLAELLPPRRAEDRFALERISPSFAQICIDHGTELRDLLLKALASLSRDDPSIALNLINHVLEKAPKFYPALMLKGSLLLEMREDVQRIPDLFETASTSPPRTENTQRYKLLALELLADSLEVADNHAEAIRVLRRIQKIVSPTTLFDYHAARLLSASRKTGEAFSTMDIVVRQEPRYYALSLLEDDFELIRDQILTSLEERSQRWIDTTDKVLEMADHMRVIAEDYGVDDDPVVREGLDELNAIQQEAKQGSYTTLRDLKEAKLTDWARKYPARIQEILSKMVEERYEAIRQFNRDLHRHVVEKRQEWTRRWGLPWAGVGLLLVIALLLLKQPIMGAVFMFIVWLVAGYGVLKIFETRYEGQIQGKKKDAGSLRMVQGEIRRIHGLRSEIIIALEKESEQDAVF